MTRNEEKGNGALHGIVDMNSVRTEPVLRDEPPEGQKESWIPPFLSDISDIDPFFFTPSSPGSTTPPSTRSGSGSGLEDVSSLCYGPLPLPSEQIQHTHSLEPIIHRDSIVDGCHQLPTLDCKATGIYSGGIEASSESSNTQLS